MASSTRTASPARRAARKFTRKHRRAIRVAAVLGVMSTAALASILTVLELSPEGTGYERRNLSGNHQGSSSGFEMMLATAPTSILASAPASDEAPPAAHSNLADSGITAPPGAQSTSTVGELLSADAGEFPLPGIPDSPTSGAADRASRATGWGGVGSTSSFGGIGSSAGAGIASAASGGGGASPGGGTGGGGSPGGGGIPGGSGPSGSPATSGPGTAPPTVTASAPPATAPTDPTSNSPAAPPSATPPVIASAPPAASPPADSGAPTAGAPTSTPGSTPPPSPPPTIISTGPVEGFGPIDGPVSVVPGGILAPGASPGELVLNHNFTLDGGILEIDIWGDTPIIEHDLLTILGEAHFMSGAIQFVFSDDSTGDVFTPAAGDMFTFLTADGGIFGFDNNANISLFSLDLASGLDIMVTNNNDALTLEIIATTEPRDLLTSPGGSIFEVENGGLSGPQVASANAVSAPGTLALHGLGVSLLLAGAMIRRIRRAASRDVT